MVKPKASKAAPKAAPVKKSTIDREQFASYVIRQIPRGAWEAFKTRIQSDGRSIQWVLNQYIEKYGQHAE